MPYLKILWSGILLWIILFVLASILLAYGYLHSLRGEVGLLLATVVLALYFAHNLKPSNLTRALVIGIIWAIIGIAFDLLITRPLASASPVSFFTQWSYWLSYLLIVLAPTFRIESIPDSYK